MINDNDDQEHFNSTSHWDLGHLFTKLLAEINYFLNSILFSLPDLLPYYRLLLFQ